MLLQRTPGKENSAISCLAWTFDKSSRSWRLFSGGLDGLLTEWDLTTLQAGTVSDSFGGAIWSLAVAPHQGTAVLHFMQSSPMCLYNCQTLTVRHRSFYSCTQAAIVTHTLKAITVQSAGESQRIAVACDDGALRIFEAQDNVPGLQYAKTFPRTDGRVLSAAWHPDHNTLVTGTSTGVMHAWEVSSNRELLRITAGWCPRHIYSECRNSSQAAVP